ncbi:MAG: RnfABCDGE type electron transport complex subunit G [Candidatus Mcinerneyibacterium aminivorans]|uniref:Ion-translocating oxidoreductase complex subunit G n=1 Tax=Candidatus Mcinerneyibacterium aminivorans TaxID=2703815 RepID=A0A5D0MJ62_9BACT|nr:MAG: RnfABCDGE type electron transport complex subunit G [Candidatus Mcinerneyibacterium aminivorans]
MKKYLKLPVALLIITFISGFLLSYANKITEPKIQKLQEEKEQKARKKVLPDASKFEAKKLGIQSKFIDNEYWIGYDKNNNIVGFVAKVFKNGYSSRINIMVGVLPSKKIQSISILKQAETPGLGAKCEQNWFQEQFDKLKAGSIEVLKSDVPEDKNAIKAITAATITSKAVTDGINNGINILFNNISNKVENSDTKEKGDK